MNFFRSLKDEQWKPHPDFPLYEVSNRGRVRSFQTYNGKRCVVPHLLRPSFSNRNGKARVTFSVNGVSTVRFISDLVLTLFNVPRPSARHVSTNKDGDKRNNNLDNLHWTLSKGDKLVESQVLEIRQKYLAGHSITSLATAFSVSDTTVKDIIKKRTWKHL